MSEKEYIERGAALGALCAYCACKGDDNEPCSCVERELTLSIPAADVVEVRHGEWFLLDECSNDGVYCSVCAKKVYRTEYANQKLKSPFCPNCGAKMDGGKTE